MGVDEVEAEVELPLPVESPSPVRKSGRYAFGVGIAKLPGAAGP